MIGGEDVQEDERGQEQAPWADRDSRNPSRCGHCLRSCSCSRACGEDSVSFPALILAQNPWAAGANQVHQSPPSRRAMPE